MSNFNFNINQNPEYDLNTSLIEETISLYGILTKFLKVQKINMDSFIFKDFSSLKTNASDCFDVYMMPEISEAWDSGGINFSQFGMVNIDNVSLFCAKSSMDNIGMELTHLIGNLVVMPNNKIMEITNVQFEVPGVNNLFTYNNSKSVYKFSLIPYNVKINDELDTSDILHDDTAALGVSEYNTLNKYFDELTNNKIEVDRYSEILDTVETVKKTGIESESDIIIKKPIISREEDDVFGNF